MPILRIRDNMGLDENAYRVLSFDNVLFESVIDGEEAPYYKIIDDTVETCDKHYAAILNKNLVKIMIDNLEEIYPGVVEDIIPSKISYLQSIRNLLGILEDMELNL